MKTTIDSIIDVENVESMSDDEFLRRVGIHNMLLKYIKAGFFAT